MPPQLVETLHDVHERVLDHVLGFLRVAHDAPDAVDHKGLIWEDELVVIVLLHGGLSLGEEHPYQSKRARQQFVYSLPTESGRGLRESAADCGS